MDLRREKLDEKTIHLKLTPSVREALELYADSQGRPVTKQIEMFIEESLFGKRDLRLLLQLRDAK
jgi:hypothetical protein